LIKRIKRWPLTLFVIRLAFWDHSDCFELKKEKGYAINSRSVHDALTVMKKQMGIISLYLFWKARVKTACYFTCLYFWICLSRLQKYQVGKLLQPSFQKTNHVKWRAGSRCLYLQLGNNYPISSSIKFTLYYFSFPSFHPSIVFHQTSKMEPQLSWKSFSCFSFAITTTLDKMILFITFRVPMVKTSLGFFSM